MLKAIHKCNEREIEMMVGKAACARANAIETFKLSYTDPRFRHVPQEEVMAELHAEEEATVRCIAMFVENDIYEIQRYVRESAEAILGEE